MSSQTTSKRPRPPVPQPMSVRAPPLSPPALLPAKRPKKARKLSSPPALSPVPPVAAPSLEVPPLPLKNGNKQVDKSTRNRGVSGAVLDDSPSVFNVLNMFRHRWFLHRDHLLANILLAQKDDAGNIVWVDFLPPFHTHLVQRALSLLPPLCPVAKGEKVMFVFLLEVIAGEGPTTFFDLPKKRTLKARPRSPVIWQSRVASSPAILPLAASPAPPPPPVALTPAAHLNCLDRPPTLGPPLPPKYQYDAGKWAQKEQALADEIRLVGKWSPSHWVGATVMNFLVRDPPSCFLNTFASSLIDVDWVEAWVEQGVSRCLDGALRRELAEEYAVSVECTVVPPGERPNPFDL